MRFLFLFLGLLFSGCTTSEFVRVPRLPVWQAPADTSPVTTAQIFAGVILHSPGAQLITSDTTYTRVNAQFAKELIKWARTFAFEGNIKWSAESFDCDKFAKAFTLAAELAAARAGVKAQPLAFRISVKQQKAFGGAPAMPPGQDGHALVAIVTDEDILVIEPQSGEFTSLSKYPNPIWRVTIGG